MKTKPLEERRAVHLRKCNWQLSGEAADLRLDALHRRARSEPGDHRVRVFAPERPSRVESHGEPDIGVQRDRTAPLWGQLRSLRQDTDDLMWLLVQRQPAPDHAAICAELPLPESIGQHDHRGGAGRVVSLIEQSSDGCGSAEQPE